MGVCHSYMKNMCNTSQAESEKMILATVSASLEKDQKNYQQQNENSDKYQDELLAGTENKPTDQEINNIESKTNILHVTKQIQLLNQQQKIEEQEIINQQQQDKAAKYVEQESSSTPTFLGKSDRLTNRNNSQQLHKLYEGLKAGGIISNQPLEVLIEQKLKQSSDENPCSFKSPILNNETNQPQSLKRSTTTKFANDSNYLDQNSPNDDEQKDNNDEEQKQKKKHMRSRLKRFQTNQFQISEEAEDLFDGKTQKSILKKKNSQSAQKLQKKTVVINEAENELHPIPKNQNFRQSYY